MKIKAGNCSGFTLIEMLVVITVLAIMSAIAVPASQNIYNSYQLKGAVRQLYSDMQTARLKAIKEGRDWGLKFAGSSYTVESIGPDGAWNTSDDEMIKAVDLAALYNGVSITVNVVNDRVEFNPNGTAVSGNVMVSGYSRAQTLCINSSTGNVRIVDGAGCV